MPPTAPYMAALVLSTASAMSCALFWVRIAIHAAARRPVSIMAELREINRAAASWLSCPLPAPHGAVLCTAHVHDFRVVWPIHERAACCRIEHHCYGLDLRDVRVLGEPVPARGRQGIWYWTPPEGVEA